MPRSTRKGLYRVIYLVKGRRAAVPATLQFDAAMREFAALKRRGFTAWIESDSGEFVPVEGAMRKPAEIVNEHRVADFNSIPELIEHAKGEGASAILVAGQQVTLYFPRRDGRYDAATIWNQNGYWHAPSKSARSIVTRLPAGAESIGSHTQRVGRRASEGREIQHELWLCEDCTIAEVNSDYSGMSDDRAAEVEQGISQLVERVGPISANWDSETEEGIKDFSSRRCDACGTGLAGTRHRFASFGREGMMEASRPRRGRRKPSITGALQLATELSKEVSGSAPKELPGGFRWSEKNEAAQFTTYSPEHSQKVVVVVSVFEDASVAVDYFSDEELSETDRYENIGHFMYETTADLPEMKKDIEWVWETVDGYAASWQDDEEGNPLEEARPETDTAPNQPIDRKTLTPGVWIEVRDPSRRTSYGSDGSGIYQVVKVGRVNVLASIDVRFSPTGPWYHQEHTIPLSHVVRVVPNEEVAPRGVASEGVAEARHRVSEREPSFKRPGARVKYNYTDGPIPAGTLGTIIGFLPKSYQAQIRWDNETISNHTPDEYNVIRRNR